MPYTRDLAHELVDEMERLGGPTPDNWVQMAVDSDEGLVGDVAVWLDTDGDPRDDRLHARSCIPGSGIRGRGGRGRHRLAVPPQTRAPGRGDPRSPQSRQCASPRELRIRVRRHGPLGCVRAGRVDRRRPLLPARTGLACVVQAAHRSPRSCRPRRVTSDNVRAVGEIDRAFSQRAFVVARSRVARRGTRASHGGRSPDRAVVPGDRGRRRPRRFRDDGRAVRRQPAPLPVADGHRPSPPGPRHRATWPSNRSSTNAGAAGHTHITVSYVADAVGSPARFYGRLGFVPTGRIDDGETEAILALDR